MRHRGVTLLELLVVIALLLGAAAVVLPSLGGQLSERAFTATGEQIEAQLLTARAEAMARGTPVEVRWLPQSSEISITTFDARRDSMEGDGVETVELLEGIDRNSPAWSDAMLENLVPLTDVTSEEGAAAPISSIEIPREHRIAAKLDEATAARFDRGFAPDNTLPPGEDQLDFSLESGEPATSRAVRLAVYLADGSALLSRPLWVIDDDDRNRVARLEINPWTGLPRLERVEVRDANESGVSLARDDAGDFALDEVEAGQ